VNPGRVGTQSESDASPRSNTNRSSWRRRTGFHRQVNAVAHLFGIDRGGPRGRAGANRPGYTQFPATGNRFELVGPK
jgi:hypothetical protein